MKLEIQLGGNRRTVELGRVEGRPRWMLDGMPLEADAVEIARGSYSILMDGESFEVRVEAAIDALRIFVGEQEFLARIRDPRQWRRNRGAALEAEGRQQVIAPMPGKVVRILVGAGDRVAAGQGILVVEAMKMQNEIRSPKAGRIERIPVKEAQTVNAGEVVAVVA